MREASVREHWFWRAVMHRANSGSNLSFNVGIWWELGNFPALKWPRDGAERFPKVLVTQRGYGGSSSLKIHGFKVFWFIFKKNITKYHFCNNL